MSDSSNESRQAMANLFASTIGVEAARRYSGDPTRYGDVFFAALGATVRILDLLDQQGISVSEETLMAMSRRAWDVPKLNQAGVSVEIPKEGEA